MKLETLYYQLVKKSDPPHGVLGHGKNALYYYLIFIPDYSEFGLHTHESKLKEVNKIDNLNSTVGIKKSAFMASNIVMFSSHNRTH